MSLTDKNLQVGKRTYDLDELTDNLIYFPGERTADFFNELGLQVERDLRINALKDSIRPHLNNPHQLEKLTMDMKYRLGWFETFSEFQLLNLIDYLNDDNINRNYKKSLWAKLIELIIESRVPEKTTIRLFKMAYDIGTSRKKYFEKVSDFNKKIDSIFVDEKEYIDGLLPNVFRSVLFASSTTNEIKKLGKKYGVAVPRRLKKQELLDIMIEELKDRDEYTEELEAELDTYNIIKLERYCINNDIKASTELKKEEIIEYILKNAKETMHTYYVPDNPGVYHIIAPEQVKEVDYFEILNLEVNVDEEKELVIHTSLENPEIKYTNYDDELILITEDNTVKGLNEGMTSVKATLKALGLQTIFNVSVKMDNIFINTLDCISIIEGETHTLKYNTNDKAGVTITSLDENILNVQGNLLTALKEGSTKVLLTSNSKSEISKEVDVLIESVKKEVSIVELLSPLYLRTPQTSYKLMVEDVLKLDYETNAENVVFKDYDENIININENNEITALKPGLTKVNMYLDDSETPHKELIIVVEEKTVSQADYDSLLQELIVIKQRLTYLEEDKASKIENESINEKLDILSEKIEEINKYNFHEQLNNLHKENKILYEELEDLREKIKNIKVEPDVIKQFIFDNEGVNYLEDDIKGFYTNAELIDSMIDNLEDLHTFIMDLYNRLLLTENDIKLVKDILGTNLSLSLKDLKDINEEDK